MARRPRERNRTYAERPAPIDLAATMPMRDMQALMRVADRMKRDLAGQNVQDMTPDQLREAMFDAAGGEENLRRLMRGG